MIDEAVADILQKLVVKLDDLADKCLLLCPNNILLLCLQTSERHADTGSGAKMMTATPPAQSDLLQRMKQRSLLDKLSGRATAPLSHCNGWAETVATATAARHSPQSLQPPYLTLRDGDILRQRSCWTRIPMCPKTLKEKLQTGLVALASLAPVLPEKVSGQKPCSAFLPMGHTQPVIIFLL